MGIVLRDATIADRIEAGPAYYQEPVAAAGFGPSFKAAYVEENSFAQWYTDIDYQVEAEALDNYDQYNDIPGDLADVPLATWRGVDSPLAMQSRVSELRAERERRDVAATNGWGSFVGSLFGYVTSPEFPLELLATSGASGYAGALRVGGAALAGGTLHEAAMHSESYSRSWQQSMVNIGLNTFAGAGVGAVFGTGVSRAAEKAYVRQLTQDLREAVAPNAQVVTPSNAQSIGAAAVASADEQIINKPWLNWAWLAPVRPLAHATANQARMLFNNLVEHSYTPLKTTQGAAKQVSLETRVNQEIAGITNRTHKALGSGYKKWAAEQQLGRGQRLRPKNWQEFQRQLHEAMIHGDQHTSVAVAQTAKALRTTYDEIFAIAQNARKEFPDAEDFLSLDDYLVKFADSYVPRRYNKRAIQKDQIAFKEELAAAFKQERELNALKQAKGELAEQVKTLRQDRAVEGAAKRQRLEARLVKLDQKIQTLTKGSREAIVTNSKRQYLKGQLKRLKTRLVKEEAKGLAAEQQMQSLRIDQFRITAPEELQDIATHVNASYERIVHSYDLDVYMTPKPGGGGSPFKERMIPLRDEDMLARGWLESDMQAMTHNYVNRLLKPSRVLLEQGDTELKNSLKLMNEEYEALKEAAKQAGKLDEVLKLEKEQGKVREAFEVWRDRWYGRTTISSSRKAEAVNDILRTIRNLNVARLMGMVTPVSVGDIFRANLTTIFAPELGVKGPGLLQAIQSAKASSKAFKDFGIAHEVASYVRTGKMLDDSGLLEGTSRAVELSSAASKGLMKAAGLAHWTDWMKEVAAAYTQNDLIQKMRGFAKLGQRSRAQLAQLGIDEQMAKRLQAEIAGAANKAEADRAVVSLGKEVHGYEGNAYVLQWDNFADRELAERLKNILFRESERNIVTPAVGEIPRLTASDEINKMIFQFQSFLFGAAHSVTVNLGMRLRLHDPKSLLIMTNMILGGMLSVGLRKSLYGEFEEMANWSPQDWVLNGMDYSSITPLFMMGFNHVNVMTGNTLVNSLGATSMARYQHRPLGSLLGPSVGFGEDVLVAAQSIIGLPLGENMTPTDIRRLRRLIPYNNLAYIAAGITKVQKAVEEVVE